MTISTIINKGGFEAGLDAGNDAFINVALALLFGGGFNIEIDELLSVDDGHAQLFSLRGIK